MKNVDIEITNEVGLHARPAALFVQTASKYEADITVSYDGKTINAKSILGILSLGVGKDSLITISADGADEEAAVEALVDLIDTNFGE